MKHFLKLTSFGVCILIKLVKYLLLFIEYLGYFK